MGAGFTLFLSRHFHSEGIKKALLGRPSVDASKGLLFAFRDEPGDGSPDEPGDGSLTHSDSLLMVWGFFVNP